MATKNNPGDFDCYANAEPDEPMFILLGRDPAADACILLWVRLRLLLGQSKDDPQIQEALKCAEQMAEYAGSMGKAERVMKALLFLKRLLKDFYA